MHCYECHQRLGVICAFDLNTRVITYVYLIE